MHKNGRLKHTLILGLNLGSKFRVQIWGKNWGYKLGVKSRVKTLIRILPPQFWGRFFGVYYIIYPLYLGGRFRGVDLGGRFKKNNNKWVIEKLNERSVILKIKIRRKENKFFFLTLEFDVLDKQYRSYRRNLDLQSLFNLINGNARTASRSVATRRCRHF